MTSRACDKFEPDLSAYLDDELAADRRRAVERHLASCADCRRALEELRGVIEKLAALPRRPAPEVILEVVRRQAERRALLGGVGPRRSNRILLFAARFSASAALISACAFIGWRMLARPQSLPAPALVKGPAAQHEMERAPAHDKPAETLQFGLDNKDEKDLILAGRGVARDEVMVPAVAEALPAPAFASGAAMAAADADDKRRFAGTGGQTPGGEAALGEPAAIEVLVSPQTPAQFNAALQVVQDAEETTRVAAAVGGDAAAPAVADGRSRELGQEDELRRGRFGGRGEPEGQTLEFRITRAQVRPLMDELEKQTPGQVAMKFQWEGRESLRELLENSDALGLESPQAGEQPADDSTYSWQDQAAKEEAAARQQSAAAEKKDAAAPRVAHKSAAARGGRSNTATTARPGEAAPPAAAADRVDARTAPLAQVGLAQPATPGLASRPANEPTTQARAGGAPRAQALRERASALLRTLAEQLQSHAGSAASPDGETVRLRVILLPPGETPASQPAAADDR